MSLTENDDRIYPFGYGPTAVGMMERRSAQANAGFVLEHLKPGMRVLDIGCGPGTITVGFAPVVAPGEVVGLDIEESQIELARQRAESLQLDNCQFETGSVFDLPFPASSFDVVYGHTILMQFDTAADVLAEVMRVLEPNGLVGFREVDLGASLYYPDGSAVQKFWALFRQSVFDNGGNPDVGRTLPALLSDSGFEVVYANAAYNCAATPEAKQKTYISLGCLWRESMFPAQAETLGRISAKERASMAESLREEASDPATFYASTYAEVIARKPK